MDIKRNGVMQGIGKPEPLKYCPEYISCKSKLIIILLPLLLSAALYGCSTSDENKVKQNENTAISGENQDESVPTKAEVLAAREQALEGMSAEETERLKENIKVANQRMESAYLNDNIFEKLEDKESLYWNYFDEKGEIQIGWAYDGSYQEMKTVMDNENLSRDEFYSQYGTPVMEYNRFDAENFMELLEEMKETVKNEKLQKDLQQIIDETALAAQTHEMEHAYNIYKLLHDMDYYLLRYGLEDVGKYVQDVSLIAKYYGVLTIYDSSKISDLDVAAISGGSEKVNEKAAIEKLTGQIVSMGIVDADMQMEDGKRMEWNAEEISEVEIAGVECYAFELRYSDDESINGEMTGRLIASYAVSKSGGECYRYNAADDVWEETGMN